jgi:hypothetical protein
MSKGLILKHYLILIALCGATLSCSPGYEDRRGAQGSQASGEMGNANGGNGGQNGGTPGGPGTPDPSRSQLTGVNCPWGADASANAAKIMQAGFTIDYSCKYVVFNETLYGTRTPNYPTFDDVKRSYDDTLAAMVARPDAMKALKNVGATNLVFDVDPGKSRLAFPSHILYIAPYDQTPKGAIFDYLQGVIEYDRAHFDGLPVITVQGNYEITGSDLQTQNAMTALGKFSSTYAQYRDDFKAAGEAIREIDIDERLDQDTPLFRNGGFRMAPVTQNAWAVEDALQVAKAYLTLPRDFRESVDFEVTMPDLDLPQITHPERLHAQAAALLSRKLAVVRAGAPGLQKLNFTYCSPGLINGLNNCGALDSTATSLDLAIFVYRGLDDISLYNESDLDDELTRIFGPH